MNKTGFHPVPETHAPVCVQIAAWKIRVVVIEPGLDPQGFLLIALQRFLNIKNEIENTTLCKQRRLGGGRCCKDNRIGLVDQCAKGRNIGIGAATFICAKRRLGKADKDKQCKDKQCCPGDV